MQPNQYISRTNAIRFAYRSSNAPFDRHSLPPPQPPTPAAAVHLSGAALQQTQQLVHAQGPPLTQPGARLNGKKAKTRTADDQDQPTASAYGEAQSADLDIAAEETPAE